MKKLIIIGNGMVSYKFCEKLMGRMGPGTFDITVFGEESRPAYDRVHLSAYFLGKSASDLELADASWYADNGIRLFLGDPVVEINRADKQIISHSGQVLRYDCLVMATGSAAFIPRMEGTGKQGVFIYRTIEDLELMTRYSKVATKAAVLGGGLLGLEAAKALLDLGIRDTSVIEYAPRLMPRQIDAAGSEVLSGKLSALGLQILTGKQSTAILGAEAISAVQFSDGSTLAVDMLVISAGIQPRDELACQAGLKTGPRGGIVVNDKMQTSDPSIYAIGECALYNQTIYGLVAPGYEMAEVALSQILNSGSDKLFLGYDMSTKLKLIGIDVASFGEPAPSPEISRSVTFQDQYKGIYKKIHLSSDGKYLLGGILIGEADDYHMLLQICKNKMALPPAPESLILGNKTEQAGSATDLGNLPDDAIICSCESVTKAAICNSVKDGKEQLSDIKQCTKAGTGCGGCIPMVKDLIEFTMKSEGKYVRHMICEHFNYTRQELFDLINLKQLKSFDAVIDHCGSGDGCEICKPVVSSILASLWNEMILARNNDTAQDSNDRFLANIQKGGTYSVVPRVPGGEITPVKLIAMGEIASKYDLYTKITGGQRIDLFGAHLKDLPLIWTELIAAGFESGHAYGKALRTVKSCVGSSWCRFGLHDSVSFAIQIENRYKGLRAPHKLKSAVSGCIRECAEARSKDFGIIATEKGWNLFVCGNGGSNPRHASLLVSDVDSDTCIRYIDRFLMFYIQTAEPLMRTAAWLSKMEGGIDYLRNVVVEDALGMAKKWEQDMQLLVDQFECEWKVAISTPEIRKRFSHFINAQQENDPTVHFDSRRNQKSVTNWI